MLKKIVFVLFVFAVLLRLSGVEQAVYDDEVDYLVVTQIDTFYGLNNVIFHPPLAVWFSSLIVNIFGVSSIALRIGFMIFALLTVYFSYLLGKRFYGERAGLFAVFIMLFSFYHILASLQIDMEGSLLAFFYIFALFCFVKYKDNKRKYWYVLSAVTAGLALLSKESSLLLLIIIYLYDLSSRGFSIKNAFESIKSTSLIGLIALIIFSVYPILNYFSAVNYMAGVRANIIQNLFNGISFLGISMFLFWAGPFLIGLAVLGLIDLSKKDRLFFIWIFIVLLFYILLFKKGDHSRYFMNIIPPMAILGGKYLSKLEFDKKAVLTTLISFILFLTGIFALNIGKFRYLPRDISIYFNELINFNTDFVFSFTSSSGPLFVVSFISILVGLFASGLFLFMMLNKKSRRVWFFIFLGVSFAFNIFLIQEYLFHTMHANPGEVINKMNEYDIDYPLYSNAHGVLFNFDNKYVENLYMKDTKIYYMGVYGEKIDDFMIEQALINNGGNVLVFDYPKLPKGSRIWRVIKNCSLDKEFLSKSVVLGYAYSC